MADPLSIAGSVVGIAAAGAKVSISLFNLAETVTTASDRVTSIANDITSTCGILSQLGELVKPQKEPDGSYTTVFTASALSQIYNALIHCRSIFNQIKKYLKRATKQVQTIDPEQKSKIELSRSQKAKWPFFQPQFHELRNDLRDSKGNLLFMVALASLIVAQETRPGRQIDEQEEKDMKALVVRLDRARTMDVKSLDDVSEEEKKSGIRKFFRKIGDWRVGRKQEPENDEGDSDTDDAEKRRIVPDDQDTPPKPDNLASASRRKGVRRAVMEEPAESDDEIPPPPPPAAMASVPAPVVPPISLPTNEDEAEVTVIPGPSTETHPPVPAKPSIPDQSSSTRPSIDQSGPVNHSSVAITHFPDEVDNVDKPQAPPIKEGSNDWPGITPKHASGNGSIPEPEPPTTMNEGSKGKRRIESRHASIVEAEPIKDDVPPPDKEAIETVDVAVQTSLIDSKLIRDDELPEEVAAIETTDVAVQTSATIAESISHKKPPTATAVPGTIDAAVQTSPTRKVVDDISEDGSAGPSAEPKQKCTRPDKGKRRVSSIPSDDDDYEQSNVTEDLGSTIDVSRRRSRKIEEILQAWTSAVLPGLSSGDGHSVTVIELAMSEDQMRKLMDKGHATDNIVASFSKFNTYQRRLILEHLEDEGAKLLYADVWGTEKIPSVFGELNVVTLIWITSKPKPQHREDASVSPPRRRTRTRSFDEDAGYYGPGDMQSPPRGRAYIRPERERGIATERSRREERRREEIEAEARLRFERERAEMEAERRRRDDQAKKALEELKRDEEMRKRKEEVESKARAEAEMFERRRKEEMAKRKEEMEKREAEAKYKAAKEKANAEEKVAKEAAETEARKSLEKEAAMAIKFKDAVGRKFSFPWKICKTWKGMEELIKQAFLHVDVIGPHVHEGHYDLVGPDGEIILPQVWEFMVRPGWSVTMHMWPMPEPAPPPAPVNMFNPPPPPPPPMETPQGGMRMTGDTLVNSDLPMKKVGRRKGRPAGGNVISIPPPPPPPRTESGAIPLPPPPPLPMPVGKSYTFDTDSNSSARRKTKVDSMSPFFKWAAGISEPSGSKKSKMKGKDSILFDRMTDKPSDDAVVDRLLLEWTGTASKKSKGKETDDEDGESAV